FYNLFLYITVRDITYIFYVGYILLITLAQGTLHGYTFKYLWPGSPWMAQHSIFVFPSLASIAAMLFAKFFLHTRQQAPALDKVLKILIGVFALSILLGFLGQYGSSFQLMQVTTLITSLFILYMTAVILRRGFHPAKYFLLAWFALLTGATILVLRDYGILPSNDFTSNALVFGCAVEVILLSFALAHKISVLRKEKEESREQTLAAMAEIARMGREQNVILETKVQERTLALKQSNEELNKALHELKEAESQLVESEKMASLGQLTAGIAHEINNPTNFVTSNVTPLTRDIGMIVALLEQIEGIAVSAATPAEKQSRIQELKDKLGYEYLKTEVDNLIRGIREGSNRTAEIVKGLRSFSRLDEDILKEASVNEGIDSTLIIVNHMLEGSIEIVKSYGQLPAVECYPGKLNQVFLNILTNGLHAVKAKFRGHSGGMLTITTFCDDTTVTASFRDNGIGMDTSTRDKMFEPFFTTKEA
ncbi:MAG TPA: 7TM diverse intracellular signaling domain-containing protein, partial [Anseongella sp.]|nr:7TM diverse intracellular signaling domain-containing protein [Anseongella sp.]